MYWYFETCCSVENFVMFKNACMTKLLLYFWIENNVTILRDGEIIATGVKRKDIDKVLTQFEREKSSAQSSGSMGNNQDKTDKKKEPEMVILPTKNDTAPDDSGVTSPGLSGNNSAVATNTTDPTLTDIMVTTETTTSMDSWMATSSTIPTTTTAKPQGKNY